jgi:hypothetical protein
MREGRAAHWLARHLHAPPADVARIFLRFCFIYFFSFCPAIISLFKMRKENRKYDENATTIVPSLKSSHLLSSIILSLELIEGAIIFWVLQKRNGRT